MGNVLEGLKPESVFKNFGKYLKFLEVLEMKRA